MRKFSFAFLLVVILVFLCPAVYSANATDTIVDEFAVSNVPLGDAIAKLAVKEGLCASTEHFQSSRSQSYVMKNLDAEPKVSIDAKGKSIGEILNALVAQDSRYDYLVSGKWINVGQREHLRDPANPLNMRITTRVVLTNEAGKASTQAEVGKWIREHNIHSMLVGSMMTLKYKKEVNPQTIELENPTFREYLNWTYMLQGRTHWSVNIEPMQKGDGWMFISSYGVMVDS